MAKKTIKMGTNNKCLIRDNCSSPSCVWFLGFIGAAIYNVSNSIGFFSGMFGIVKAIVWPVFLVFRLMQFLGM